MLEKTSNELEKAIRDQLDKITVGLNGQSGRVFRRLTSNALNFSASLGLFANSRDPALGLNESLSVLLGGSIKTEEVADCSLENLITSVRDSISWPGDHGAHPDSKYLSSEEFENDMELLLAELESLFLESSSVRSFVLTEGHPFYPVFWEFAFVFLNENRIRVLIGSSSD